MSSAPRQQLAIYRLKPAPASAPDPFADVLDADTMPRPTEMSADVGGDTVSKLFVRSTAPDHPKWAAFLEPAAKGLRQELEMHAANSAVLIVVAGKDRYAFSFGHGRALLRPGCIERGFGLRCALDLIDEESMVSVGIRQVDHKTLFSNIQANKSLRFDEFRVDTEASLLSGVLGRGEKKPDYYSRVLGSDALHLNPRATVHDLPALLDWVDKVYQKKGYVKLGYDWIDHVEMVRDASILQTLEAHLDSELAKTAKPIDVGPPEWIDYEDVTAFTVQGSRKKRLEKVSLADIEAARDLAPLTVGALKKARIKGLDDDDDEVQSWSAFNWLTWGGTVGGEQYVLQDGDFFRVDPTYEKRIDRFLAKIAKLPADWPDWSGARTTVGTKVEIKDEYEYNKDLEAHLGSDAVFLDQEIFTKSFRGRGKLEFCDLFLKGKPAWLIAAKKYANSSASISHLVAQGMNAFETLLRDEPFRAELRAYQPKGTTKTPLTTSIPVDAPRPSKYGITFVILTDKKRRKVVDLPFFAKLTLFRHGTQAKQAGIAMRVGTRAIK